MQGTDPQACFRDHLRLRRIAVPPLKLGRYAAKSLMMGIPERDWLHFRKVHAAALERFCERILKDCSAVIASPDRSAHDRYLDLFRLVREREDQLDVTFNDLRRSTALRQLITMYRLGLILDGEMLEFTKETRTRVEAVIDLF